MMLKRFFVAIGALVVQGLKRLKKRALQHDGQRCMGGALTFEQRQQLTKRA